MIGVVEEETFTDRGLEPETTYTYAVKAFDDYENESDISEELPATTKRIMNLQLFQKLTDLPSNRNISNF